MIVAIVGTSIILENKISDMRKEIISVLKKYSINDTLIISGGAKGVDKLALEIAKELGFQTKEHKPEKNQWEYYKRRNLQIAKDCDILYCFTVLVYKNKCYHHNSLQDHEKTAGCWTANKALQMNKECQLIVI